LPVGVERRRYRSDWRLNAVLSGLDPVEISQSGDKANGAVPAHSEIADVVEENDAGGTCWVQRFTKQRAHHHIGSTRFIDYCGAKSFMPSSNPPQSLG